MSADDRNTFFMDIKCLNWDEYMKIYVLGARKFVLNEDSSTLPQCRKIFMIYWIVDIACMFSIGIFLIWAILSMIFPPQLNTTIVEVINN